MHGDVRAPCRRSPQGAGEAPPQAVDAARLRRGGGEAACMDWWTEEYHLAREQASRSSASVPQPRTQRRWAACEKAG